MDALLPTDPKKLGGWTLTGRLGAGGMGVVYMGNKGGQTAAIKIILKSDKANPQARARFKQEIQSLYLVKSPYVARLLDFKVDVPNPWYAVEYISDMSLADVLKTTGKFSGDNWWRLAHHLLMALVSIHEADVVHRDLKPGNIMIANGEPKLIDFGLAKPISDQFGDGQGLTRKNTFMGTMVFASPEQLKNARDADHKTDVWAVAITLIVAAGGNPWGKKDDGDIYIALAGKQLPDFSALDPAQLALVKAMLNFDAAARPDARTLLKNFKSYYETRVEAAQEVQVQVRNIVEAAAPAAPAAPVAAAPKPAAQKVQQAKVAKEPGMLKKVNSWSTYGRWWREYRLIFVLTLLTGGWALLPYLVVYYAKPTKALTYKQKVAYSQSLMFSLFSIGFLNPLITYLWMKKAGVESLKRTFYIHCGLWIWQVFSMTLVPADGNAPGYVGLSWFVNWIYGFVIYKRVLKHLKAGE